MAKSTKRATKRPAAKAATKKRAPARAAKAAPRKAAKTAAKKKKPAAAKKPARAKQAAPANVDGWITHTEFASSNPTAFQDWGAKVLGWKSRGSMPTPDGEYLMFSYSDMGGGGIRRLGPTEQPSVVPYVSVPNLKAAWDKALKAGAEAVAPPLQVQNNLWIATVKAPGGILIGLAGA